MKTKLRIPLGFFYILFLFVSSASAQVFINENFSGAAFPPTGWQLQSVGTGDKTFYNIPGTPTGAVVWEDKAIAQNERLITPSLNFSNLSNAYLTFSLRAFLQSMQIQNTEDFFVKISTDNGVNWTTIWNDSQMNFNNNSSITQNVSLDISAYAGAGANDVRVMFQYTTTVHNLEYTALIQLYSVQVSSCPIPQVTSQSPQIAVSVPASFSGTFDVEYGIGTFTQGSGTLITGITGNTFTIPGMDCNNYTYFIRSSCGANSSPWSNRISRPLVTNPAVPDASLTSNSAVINWSGIASSYTLEYGPLGFATGTGTTIENITSTSQLLTGLVPCTFYTVRVKAACNPSTTSWVLLNFSTLTTPENFTPLNVPFTENFNSGTLCALGYITNSPNNLIENAAMKTTWAAGIIRSRQFNLNQGETYTLNFDARKNNTNPLTGSVGLQKFNNTVFFQSIVGVFSPTVDVTNYSHTFTVEESGTYLLTFSTSGTGNASSAIFFDNITLTSNLSTNPTNLIQTKFYPNPATSTINFEFEIGQLEIYDIMGKKVKSYQRADNRFDVSNLERGVYILKGMDANGNLFTEKLIKE